MRRNSCSYESLQVEDVPDGTVTSLGPMERLRDADIERATSPSYGGDFPRIASPSVSTIKR